jgi:hypothetical protein
MEIKEYPNYKISSTGRVWSDNIQAFMSPNLPGKGTSKYAMITLRNISGPKTFLIHRLVAEAFIPNPEGLPEVDHGIGGRLDNSVTNLQWVSKSDNKQLAYDRGEHIGHHKGRTGVVLDKSTGKLTWFTNMRTASISLGKNRDYLGILTAQGGGENSKYKVSFLTDKEGNLII